MQLWGSEGVAIRTCETCGFGFADPYVAGTPEIYNLISAGATSYPATRFEFDVAISALTEAQRPLRLLEIGSGRGAFVRRAWAAGILAESVTAEFDDAALESLAAIPGNMAVKGGLQDVAARSPDPFDAICMFQVLEHMDSLSDVFDALRQLIIPGAPVFISVPNPSRTEVQERLTGFWDMPPNHIGRWSAERWSVLRQASNSSLMN